MDNTAACQHTASARFWMSASAVSACGVGLRDCAKVCWKTKCADFFLSGCVFICILHIWWSQPCINIVTLCLIDYRLKITSWIIITEVPYYCAFLFMLDITRAVHQTQPWVGCWVTESDTPYTFGKHRVLVGGQIKLRSLLESVPFNKPQNQLQHIDLT